MLGTQITIIRDKLPLPTLLVEMMADGRWKHPGDGIMRDCVPFIHAPLEFAATKEAMLFNSGPLMFDDGQNECERLSEYRGSCVSHRDLPWIDVEQTIFIIHNKMPGDDVGIALDYRTGIASPRVIGGDWHSGSYLSYREISGTFREFAELIGIA